MTSDAKYPCPTCGELKKVLNSKKNKPYYFCDLCGVQVFIRGKRGIDNLFDLIESKAIESFKARGRLEDKFEIIKIKSNIYFVEDQIEEINSKFFKSRQEKMALESLSSKLKELESDYFEKLRKL